MDDSLVFMGKAGFALFTFGLAIGVAIPRFRNPRMALSAHLTAVQMGPALITFALFWPHFGVSAFWTGIVAPTLVLSSYLLVAGIGLAAVFGASEALPIAGKGYRATVSRERIVSALVRSSSVAMLFACGAATIFMLL